MCSDVITTWNDSPYTILPIIKYLIANGQRLWVFRQALYKLGMSLDKLHFWKFKTTNNSSLIVFWSYAVGIQMLGFPLVLLGTQSTPSTFPSRQLGGHGISTRRWSVRLFFFFVYVIHYMCLYYLRILCWCSIIFSYYSNV